MNAATNAFRTPETFYGSIQCLRLGLDLLVYPNVAKVGGLQSQGDKGAAVVDLLQALGKGGFLHIGQVR